LSAQPHELPALLQTELAAVQTQPDWTTLGTEPAPHAAHEGALKPVAPKLYWPAAHGWQTALADEEHGDATKVPAGHTAQSEQTMSNVEEHAPVLKVPAGHEALHARHVGPEPAEPDGGPV
jgi:hypothetical protein